MEQGQEKLCDLWRVEGDSSRKFSDTRGFPLEGKSPITFLDDVILRRQLAKKVAYLQAVPRI